MLYAFPERKTVPPQSERSGPMQATLRLPSGGSLDLDVDDSSQALKLTVSAGGEQLSVMLPPKSAGALKSLLAVMEHTHSTERR
jgi:hypothetical protein